MMKKILNRKVLSIVALAVACVMIGAAVGSTHTATAADNNPTLVTSPYTAAVAAVEDSIVGVNNYQLVNYNNNYYGNGYGGSSFPWSDFFGFGFGNGYGNGYGNGNGNGYGNGYGNQQQEPEEIQYGSGSGVVVADKYVMTNYHVVEGASSLKVSVTTDDNGEPTLLDATVAASDADLDVAVLYVPELNLPAVTLGNSDTLLVGDYVFCIGNPLGFTKTVTAGIVSGLNREVTTGSSTDRYGRKSSVVNTMIQTDAAINSGNSGGGMFNTAGELVGIPTLKYSGSRYSSSAAVESIGMCIPVNDAKTVIDAALGEEGRKNIAAQDTADKQQETEEQTTNPGLTGKPRMGVTISTFNGSATNGVLPNGAYVVKVEAGSPAEAAGMQLGDIVVEADGQVITSSTELMNILSDKKEGDSVALKVFRTGVDLTQTNEIPQDGEYVDLTVTLAIVDAIAQ